MSSRELAELQGVSPTFLAKVFVKLEKAGIVRASEGIRGGYLLARAPAGISLLDIVEAVDGTKPLFDCREIRVRCALFGERPPGWAKRGTCAIHAAMLRAEKAMRESLAGESLADVGRVVECKAPAGFAGDVRSWIERRAKARTSRRPPLSAAFGEERP